MALVLYFVGGLIFALRLHALGLPIDAGVALLPTSALMVAAVRALALTIVVGAVVLLIVRVLDPILKRPSRGPRLVVAAGLLLLLLGAVVAYPVLAEPMSNRVRVGLIALGLLAFVLVVVALVYASSHRVLAYQLVAIVLILGTVLRGVAEYLPPTEMDFMSVRLKSGHITDGYYLASDGNTVFLVPNVGGRSIGIITAVPRSDVASLKLVHEAASLEPVGYERQRALVGRLASLPTLSQERKRRRDELFDYGADIRAHVGWRFPPILPVEALQFLLDNYDNFYKPEVARRLPATAERVPLEALLRNPHLYVGYSAVVRGRFSESTLVRATKATERRIITLRHPKFAGMEASCELTRTRPFSIRANSLVDLHATVVAWGSFNIRAGKAVEETLLACAAGRPVIPEPKSKVGPPPRRPGFSG